MSEFYKLLLITLLRKQAYDKSHLYLHSCLKNKQKTVLKQCFSTAIVAQ